MRISVRLYRIIAKCILAFVMIILAGVLIFVGLQVSGKNKLYGRKNQTGPDLSLANLPTESAEEGNGVLPDPAVEDNWEEGDIRYKGVHYRYNSDVLTFLFMGIDKMTEVKAAKDGIDGGQSDALFLLVLNPHTMQASIIGINRDTMTDIDVYSKTGSYMGTTKGQICLQHGYGDGGKESCERTQNTVSKLFYNLPIHGYCAINMGAIPLINDAVGGVEVKVLEDVINSNLKEGQTVTLKGQQAYQYLHNRDTRSDFSAGRRLERQKQYLSAYAATAITKMKQDITLPVKIYTTISKYMVTDISVDEVSYLATQALDYKFGSDVIYSLEGETLIGEKFEEFYPDETALYELILQVFYEE
ncbi:MAG: LCP family protein, partial [Lachnospiraceae bacterium]|nr:LCP family protein [Lachnospiraceae bacterium]